VVHFYTAIYSSFRHRKKSHIRWLTEKLRYQGKNKAYAWYILQAMAYNLKRLSKLFLQSLPHRKRASFKQETTVF